MITICNECIFAKKDEDGKQTGCSFTNDFEVSYLDIFKGNNNAKLKDDNFYEINRLCNACTKCNNIEDLPANYKEIVATRIKPKIDLIIFGEHKNNIEALKRAKDKGYQKIYVCYPFQINSRHYFDLRAINDKVIIVSQIDSTHDYCEIDSAVDKSESKFVVIQDSSKEIADNIVETVYNIYFNELREFICIVNTEDNLNGLVILTKAFKYFNGNKEKLVHQKIIEVNQNKEMILSWNQK